MATWEDGPEYAPIERPDNFSGPEAAPLEVAPAPHQPAADAPKDRPRFDDPQVLVAPLSALVWPVADDGRDPQRPFDVAASTLTTTSSASAWGSAHWSGPGGTAPGTTGPVAPFAQPWGPPVTDPWSGGPAPTPDGYGGQPNPQAYPPPNLPPQGFPHQGFPAPGTPQWFGPGPGQSPVPSDEPVTAKRVVEMVTPGLIICLVLGGFVYVLAPITLALAFWLSARVRVAKDTVRLVFRLSLAAMVSMALIGALAADPYFSAWWSFVAGWATFISWTALVLTLAFVYRALKQNAPPVPPSRPPWA